MEEQKWRNSKVNPENLEKMSKEMTRKMEKKQKKGILKQEKIK